MQQVISDAIIKILIERFAISPAQIKPSADLTQDLKLDSIDAVDLLGIVNEQFSLRISEEAFEKVVTVQDLIELLQAHGCSSGTM